MTTVTLSKYNDTYIFECQGHTGYALCGQDILCSAVSILCYTLRSYLEGAFSEGKIQNLQSDLSSGCAFIRFELCDSYRSDTVTEALTAIISGFSLLEENFPDHVKTDIC